MSSEQIIVTGDPVTVDADAVAEFAAAVGWTGEGVPPTFAARLTAGLQQAVLEHPELRIDLSRSLHTTQGSECVRPLEVGETLSAEAEVTGVRPTRGGRTISFVTTLTDSGGDVVQRLETTLLTEEAA